MFQNIILSRNNFLSTYKSFLEKKLLTNLSVVFYTMFKNHKFQVSNTTFQESIGKTIHLLENAYTNYTTDPYVLAIISYAFYKANSSHLGSVLTLLDSLAMYKG